MKHTIGYFTEMILFVIFSFVFVSFMAVETQMIAARNIHSDAIEIIQNSYYTVDINDLNDSLHKNFPDWTIKSEKVNSTNDKQTHLVTLEYNVILPMFNIEQDGTIEGYAR